MEVHFAAVDPRGLTISCLKSTWFGKILPIRRWADGADWEQVVLDALQDPTFISKDKEFETRACYYKRPGKTVAYMSNIERLVRTSDLKLSKLKKLSEERQYQSASVDYDPDFDALVIFFENYQERYIVHPIDEHVSLLYEPDTKEVVGIQVEAFERSFIRRYAKVEKAWRLSENCAEYAHGDLGDIFIILQKRQPEVAKEVGEIANHLLFSNSHSMSAIWGD